MECRAYDGRRKSMARGACAVGLQLNFSGERGLPLGAYRAARQLARPATMGPLGARRSDYTLPSDITFMNDMDEITYWIHTKRAPCLMNYDNLIKKQSEEAQCSKSQRQIVVDEFPNKRKKKRKLSLLDEDTDSNERKQSPYILKSDSSESDINFIINKTSILEKPKRAKLHKYRTKVHKKNKVVTSTPVAKVTLRRSQRRAKQVTDHNNTQLNSSLEIFSPSVNGAHLKSNTNTEQKPSDKVNKSERQTPQLLGGGDRTLNSKRDTSEKKKLKNTGLLNGQFEELSDVSGFTANYIRSTKVHSSKTPRKLQCKSNKNLVRELSDKTQDNMVVCVNKSMNTGLPRTSNILNCSTDSSQNVMNLVTLNNSEKPNRVNRGTTVLKFMDIKGKSKGDTGDSNQKRKTNLNISFQSQSSGTSRYPKRLKTHNDQTTSNREASLITDLKKTSDKNYVNFNNSDKKENPEENLVSKTRSGRTIRGLTVLVVSDSAEQVSSMASMNVASPALTDQRKTRRSTRQVRSRKSEKSEPQPADSLRDKSGFTACFSESDDDSKPLVQRKYFCT